jgi:ubiquinone/menaquinone biosynthesis C-methylase UbiE
VYLRFLDHLLYRHPFEGGSARRYARDQRPAFGDLDERLLDRLEPVLARARRLLDLGCGPGTFAAAAAARHPGLEVVAVDPSRDFARGGVVRASGEDLPFPDRSMDVAVCLSSIRHVRDRAAALAELRRVVRPGGGLVIVELDPGASADRAANHARRLGGRVLRAVFAPLVLRTAPPRDAIAALAVAAGWRQVDGWLDPIQPVYVLCFE